MLLWSSGEPPRYLLTHFPLVKSNDFFGENYFRAYQLLLDGTFKGKEFFKFLFTYHDKIKSGP